MTSQKDPDLILASASPRRKELLSRLGYPFEILESGVPEDEPSGMTPREVVQFLAALKADAVAEKLECGTILAADSVIDLDGQILGKPEDHADAILMLKKLGGRTHRVVTGVCLLACGREMRSLFSVATQVDMKAYSDEEISRYVDSGEPMDKAGAYAVQGLGGKLVASVHGCYNNVVGLPLCEVVRHLACFGLPLDTRRVYCTLPSGEPCPGAVIGDR